MFDVSRMRRSELLLLLYLFCFISGATGLIYEVIWEKYMTLFFGASAYSQAAVLTTFMAGLGLGSFLVGRYADVARSRLLLYSGLELVIGLYALVFPFFLDLAEHCYTGVLDNDSGRGFVLLVKFVLSFLIMVVPAMMMGGTLPVLARIFIHRLSDCGRQLAILYFVNTLGAVVGCLVAGFVLIGAFGFKGSMYLAAAANIAIGLIVLLIRNSTGEPVDDSSVRAVREVTRPAFRGDPVKWFLFAAFLTGLASMIYEVAWIRVLSNMLGSSTYSFAMMLAVFISGIAFGSLLISAFIDRFRDIAAVVIGLEFLLILSIGATLPLYNRVPYVFHLFSNALQHTDGTFYVFAGLKAILCAIVMFLPTLFSGMVLPVLGIATLTDATQVGRRIGSLFAFNILGTIVAAGVTGIVLIPLIGTRRTIDIGILANLTIILVFLAFLVSRPVKLRRLMAGAAILITAITVFGVPGFNRHLFLASEFRHTSRLRFDNFGHYARLHSEHDRILYFNEGLTATVAVTEEENGNRVIYINGKADATSKGDLMTQVLLGHLGNLLKPDPERVLVIGLGSGTTAYAASIPRSVKVVDIVELSDDVVTAQPFFDSVNHDILNNHKAEIFIDDAKTYLNLNRTNYDVIVSEPSNPWIAGIGNLFSTEFYQQVYDSLTDDGVFVQWLQTYETSDRIVLCVLATMRQVFSNVDLWYIESSTDLLITGYRNAGRSLDISAARRMFEQVKDHMATVGLESLEDVLLHHIANTEVVDLTLKKYEVVENSDTFPYIEYEAPKQLFLRGTAQLPNEMDQRLRTKHVSLFPFHDHFAETPPSGFFEIFRRFKPGTQIAARIRSLETIYNGSGVVASPWSRKYVLDDLTRIHSMLLNREQKAWFLRELSKEYDSLTNCFVPVPFVSFLRESMTDYLAEHPDDDEMRQMLRRLVLYEDLEGT